MEKTVQQRHVHAKKERTTSANAAQDAFASTKMAKSHATAKNATKLADAAARIK